MQTQDTPLSKRDAKAFHLLESGKVHLVLGQRFGYVDGSHGEKYQVSRDGCTCLDWLSRQPEGGCCHQRALRAVCVLYKAARTEARETGKTRLPWAVGLALKPAPAPARDWSKDKGYCFKCGADLVDGLCSGHAAGKMAA